MKFLFKIFIFNLIGQALWAQASSEEAVRAVLQNHPLAKAAAFETASKKYAEKAAVNLPDPELNAESPTGEFYALGILQSFEFPAVYTRQKRLAKAETALSEAGQKVNENDLRYTARRVFLEAQVAQARSRQLSERDSLYQAIAATATRQFAAGEIDFLQKTLAENEAGSAHQERLAAEKDAAALLAELAALTGLTDLETLSPLDPDSLISLQAVDIAANPLIAYQQQAVQVADRQISLAKSRALPTFSLGYFNQGAKNTPLDYRFRAGVGIPLWAGQYRAGTQSAQTEKLAAAARAEAQGQAVSIEFQRTLSEVSSALDRVRYYRQEALPRSSLLITTAFRMKEAGQIDYVAFLRTIEEAFAIRREYTAQLEALEIARIQLLYLAGQ